MFPKTSSSLNNGTNPTPICHSERICHKKWSQMNLMEDNILRLRSSSRAVKLKLLRITASDVTALQLLHGSRVRQWHLPKKNWRHKRFPLEKNCRKPESDNDTEHVKATLMSLSYIRNPLRLQYNISVYSMFALDYALPKKCKKKKRSEIRQSFLAESIARLNQGLLQMPGFSNVFYRENR